VDRQVVVVASEGRRRTVTWWRGLRAAMGRMLALWLAGVEEGRGRDQKRSDGVVV
jgi:hypothetical protein